MNERTVTHATFTIERTYDVPPARVFAAWSQPDAKLRWAGCHQSHEYMMDFRVGGREFSRGSDPGGPVYTVEGCYQDIVPGERLIYAYEMRVDEVRVSASLVTAEFKREGAGTRLILTEQGAFLDGHAQADDRQAGTQIGLDRLADALDAEIAAQAVSR